MSHLARLISLRTALTAAGVTCAKKQQGLIQEAYIRAVVAAHFKVDNTLGINEEQEARLWVVLDKWNSVSPINAALVLNSAKVRISRVQAHFALHGTAVGNAEFEPVAEVQREANAAPVRLVVTDLPEFGELVNKLREEAVTCHE